MNEPEILSVSSAAIINIINTAAAFILINTAKKKRWNNFLKILVGGMIARMIFVLASVWFCISILELDAAYLSISLAILYFIFLLAEIVYLNYHTNYVNLHQKNQQKAN